MTSSGETKEIRATRFSGPAEPFLGIERSLAGKRWVGRETDERRALTLSQKLHLPEIVGRILSSRGIDADTAPSFLEPRLRDLLPDPEALTDMDVAAERIASAVMQDERIAVFGDYDVDGATSSALLSRFFGVVGGRCRVYIPDRIREGYGPNGPALLELKNEGASVIVTVDCGTVAHDPLALAEEAGLDVIVVDHHVAEPSLPSATAIVNPNRIDDDSGQGQLAAVGVAFLLVVAVNRVLRNAGWYQSRPEPDLTQWLDIVALGTVCDVVPLTGVNRAFVTQGLKVMTGRRNPGIRALSDVARMDEAPGAYHLGFVLGPRVNAGGRVGASDLGTRLLSTDDSGEAVEIAERLDKFNRERQAIEEKVLAEAIETTEAGDDPGSVLFAVGEGWHPGVIGIVASRLKDRYNRPACVVSFDGDIGSASGRSVTGVDLGAAVIAARQSGLLVKGGGHQMAAGFTVERPMLKSLKTFLDERIGTAIAEGGIVPTLRLDGVVAPGAVNLELIRELARVGPFGSGNPEPRFALPNVHLDYAAVAGTDHVRVSVANQGGRQLKGIAFRCLDRPLGKFLLDTSGRPLHLAGRLRVNRWQGSDSPQILIDDAAPAW